MKKLTNRDQRNYPWAKIDGKLYFIPSPYRVMTFGFFQLEDTRDVYEVTGVHETIQPMCLKFKKSLFPVALLDFVPWAKLVKNT
jgi:hypothetical protein